MERRMLGEFLRVNDADLALLQEAVQGGEHGKVQRLAHRIKGAAQTLGALGLADACRSLDEAARAHPPGSMDAGLKELCGQSARLSEVIRQWMDRAAQ